MKLRVLLVLFAAGFALASAAHAQTAESASSADAVTSGKAGVSVRARYEDVDQDNFAKDARALTARLRFNYRTGDWKGWSGFAEFDHVFHLVNDFDSGAGTSPGKSQYPVVADPQGTDLNQLYLDYRVNEHWDVRAGRQRILLDDQRFVGGVGWRQNEQTYDGVTFISSAIPQTALQYSYIARVRRIFGPTVAAGANRVDAHLLNAKISLNDSWSLTPYYYYIDNEDVPAFSSGTLGGRVAGSLRAGDKAKLALTFEFATQSDATNNPVNYRTQYAHADVLLAMDNGLSFGAAYESLGGDATESGMMFRTPLATLHKFQGWADQFLTTPPQGIDDLYATVALDVANWTLTAVYHDFSPEAGSGDYGTELDMSATRKMSDHLQLLIKGAFFDGGVPAYPDTDKFWIVLTASY